MVVGGKGDSGRLWAENSAGAVAFQSGVDVKTARGRISDMVKDACLGMETNTGNADLNRILKGMDGKGSEEKVSNKKS